MILGIMLLFIAIFIITLTFSVRKEQLAGQQEKVLSNIFKKEALRIYVEDCLQDNLEQGLILLGKQGRIWQDQPGGTAIFVQGITGITYPSENGNRIAYGITKEIYPKKETENSFPCDNTLDASLPCQYTYPDTKVGFGELQLKKDIIEKDLKNFLINRTIWCVENFTKSNISDKAEVESTNLDLQLSIENDGINVKVQYPLKFKLGSEELFQLTTFDFFYPTKFQQLLNAAILFPLQWDQKYVDFNYTHPILQQPSFTYGNTKDIPNEACQKITLDTKEYYDCQRKTLSDIYTTLDISLDKQTTNTGDDIFIFQSPYPNILTQPQPYSFQIARQNRPPALDHINRSACPEKNYDYLVIKDDPELGDLNIKLHAIDPDEDSISYRIDSVSTLVNKNWPGKYDEEGKDIFADTLTIPGIYLQDPSEQIHTISARAIDEHSAEDQQLVRVLIDRPMKTDFSISLPYTFLGGKKYTDLFSPSATKYIISQEDPVFLSISLPSKSDAANAQSTELRYDVLPSTNSPGDFKFIIPSTDLLLPSGTNTVRFFNSEKTPKNDFTDIDIKNIQPYLFSQLTDKGKLSLSFSASYCQKEEKSSKEAAIEVKECIPHYDPAHPYAYPYDQYTFGVKEGKTDFSNFIDSKTSLSTPFVSTHNCCNLNWSFKKADEECFINPIPGCYQNAIVEEEYATCEGTRGNTCSEKKQYRPSGNIPTCGDDTKTKCKSKINTQINPSCSGKAAFSLTETGWCYDESVGCADVCTTTVIDINSDGKFNKGDTCAECTSKTKSKICYNIANKKPGTCSNNPNEQGAYTCKT